MAAGSPAQPLPLAGPEARFVALPAEPDDGAALVRPALRAPARWRALIVPGSGCESLAPSADRLARGLRQAQVVLLQKPALSPPGQPCSRAHLQADNLADWHQRALRLAAQGLASTDPQLPLVLVGLSEGAELLPGLVAARPEAAALMESLVAFTQGGQRKIERWTGQHRCATVVFDDADAFFNANTLDELQRLQPR